MNMKKQFVEPKVAKCEESLDKVTLCYNNYRGNNRGKKNPRDRFIPRNPKGRQ